MITAETRDYAALDRAVEEIGKFPFPQRNQLERIATKLRYLGLTTPEDRLCDEAQGGLGNILDDIADEIEGVREGPATGMRCASRRGRQHPGGWLMTNLSSMKARRPRLPLRTIVAVTLRLKGARLLLWSSNAGHHSATVARGVARRVIAFAERLVR